jgi:gamma-glutamylcyclotransferase (GGCT)/AIG2-like uncharacterized protein YtfP
MNIFVYGTLKKEYKNLNDFTKVFHEGTQWIGNASVPGILYKVDWYPAYKPEGKDLVYGEIYQIISSDLLRQLDQYEDAITEEAYLQQTSKGFFVEADYIRKEIVVNDITCWIYIYVQEMDKELRIDSGNFIL